MKNYCSFIAACCASAVMLSACSNGATYYARGKDPDPHPDIRRLASMPMMGEAGEYTLRLQKRKEWKRKSHYEVVLPLEEASKGEQRHSEVSVLSKQKGGYFSGLRMRWGF